MNTLESDLVRVAFGAVVGAASVAHQAALHVPLPGWVTLPVGGTVGVVAGVFVALAVGDWWDRVKYR